RLHVELEGPDHATTRLTAAGVQVADRVLLEGCYDHGARDLPLDVSLPGEPDLVEELFTARLEDGLDPVEAVGLEDATFDEDPYLHGLLGAQRAREEVRVRRNGL